VDVPYYIDPRNVEAGITVVHFLFRICDRERIGGRDWTGLMKSGRALPMWVGGINHYPLEKTLGYTHDITRHYKY
jgi:hypothetical protein